MTGFVCEVDELYRSACKGLPKYPGTQYCVLHYPGEEKKEDFRKVLESKCAQHDYNFGGTVFPEGASDFKGFEFDNANFSGATFIGKANFSEAQFSGEWTYFSGAQFSSEWTYFSEAQFSSERTSFYQTQFSGGWTSFSGAKFNGKETMFSGAQFSGTWTSFLGAQFRGERTWFSRAQFNSSEETSFLGAQFRGERTVFSETQFNSNGTDFSRAEFGSAETDFYKATLANEVAFSEATFGERVAFRGTAANQVFGSQAQAWFDYSRIEKPELVTFNTVLLHPSWFINADVRKVNFTDVRWYGMPGGPKGTLDEEIAALKKREVESPHTLLAQVCRRLSANAEETREYPLANKFHYWSMDALRKGSWGYFKGLTLKDLTKKETWSDIEEHFGLITTLYWVLSGYGVRAARAFLVLVAIWAAFTTLYVLVAPSEFRDFGHGIGYLWQTAVYSLLALARLNPEPRPEEPGRFQFLVGLEGILGPLQIALLALAIRRKVMR